MKYLWVNREVPLFCSLRWFKVWVKRVWHLKHLMSVLMKSRYLTLCGASIGRQVVIQKGEINGPVEKLSILENTFIGAGVHLAMHARIEIDERVVINDNVRLLTGTHDYQDSNWPLVAQKIVVGKYAWLATGGFGLAGGDDGRD